MRATTSATTKRHLAALGNNVVTITNRFGVDAVPPTLVSGKILTPTVSLSAFQPGTSIPLYAGVQVKTKDSGDTIVSGLRYVSADFCMLDSSACFRVQTYPNAAGSPQGTYQMGSQPANWWPSPGDYHLNYVYLEDLAGNTTYLTSTEFGGTTNFKKLFPSVVITLEP